MNDVYNRSGSRQAYAALLDMQEAKSQSEKPKGNQRGKRLDGQGVMMMQYVVME
jgi:hypothetical protein